MTVLSQQLPSSGSRMYSVFHREISVRLSRRASYFHLTIISLRLDDSRVVMIVNKVRVLWENGIKLQIQKRAVTSLRNVSNLQFSVIQIKGEMPLPSTTLRVRMLVNPKPQPHQPSRSKDWGWKKLVSSHGLDVVTCLGLHLPFHCRHQGASFGVLCLFGYFGLRRLLVRLPRSAAVISTHVNNIMHASTACQPQPRSLVLLFARISAA